MGEAEFWTALEFRLCAEFVGMSSRRHRSFWCDGFIPQLYYVSDPVPKIAGEIWIARGAAEQWLWSFTLLLPKRFRSRSEIDWESLIPPYETTRWMAFDEGRKYVEIEPAAAVPDPE